MKSTESDSWQWYGHQLLNTSLTACREEKGRKKRRKKGCVCQRVDLWQGMDAECRRLPLPGCCSPHEYTHSWDEGRPLQCTCILLSSDTSNKCTYLSGSLALSTHQLRLFYSSLCATLSVHYHWLLLVFSLWLRLSFLYMCCWLYLKPRMPQHYWILDSDRLEGVE